MRERILGMLRDVPLGLSVGQLLSGLRIDSSTFEASSVEALVLLSPELRNIDGTWRAIGSARRDRIVSAIELYSDSTGKRLFRASAALDGIPLKDQPTIDELAQILESSDGKFTLLGNAMIKRNV